MKIKPYEEAFASIKEILATTFKSPLRNASAYLRAIYGTTIADQKRLFAIILAQHNISILTKENTEPTKITANDFKTIGEELTWKVALWATNALSDNKPLAETASYLWDELALLEGQSRTIALFFLLHPKTRVVPYAQVPDTSEVQPEECFCHAHDNLLPQIALVHRILSCEMSLVQKTTLLHRLIEDCKTEIDKLVLLHTIARLAVQKSQPTFIILEPIHDDSIDPPK